MNITELRIEYAARKDESDIYSSLLSCCKKTSPTRALLRKIAETQEKRRYQRKHTLMYKTYTERLNIFLSELPRIADTEDLFPVLFKKWQTEGREDTGTLYLSLLDMYAGYRDKLAGATESADRVDYRTILEALRAYDPVSALQEKLAERKRQKQRNALLLVALNDLLVLANPALAAVS